MPLTEEQYIALIIAAIGGDTEGGLLAAQLPTYWEEIRSNIDDLNARALFVKMDAIDLLLGQVARSVTFRTSSGSSVNLSDLFDHFRQLRADLLTQITSALPGAGGAVGELTTTAPIMRDNAGQPDPNARVYRGDPLRRRGVRR